MEGRPETGAIRTERGERASGLPTAQHVNRRAAWSRVGKRWKFKSFFEVFNVLFCAQVATPKSSRRREHFGLICFGTNGL